MRRQGRELAMMALYALDNIPSFEREKALSYFWQIFSSQSSWEALFTKEKESPHPLEEPLLWQAFQKEERDETRLSSQFLSTREFATGRIRGVLENIEEIDGKIRTASRSWPLHRMPQVDRCILRLGTYEILFCAEVPPASAINEAIEISKRYAEKQSRSFINGILDRIHQTSKQR